MLTVESVDAGYGLRQVLHGVSLEIQAGQIVSLIGANGAGKSTLMKVLSGLLKPSDGLIRFQGKAITQVPTHKRVESGIVLVREGRGVFGQLSVEENLLLGGFHSRDAASMLNGIYERFPLLGQRRTQLAGSMSGGQQQLLVIGRAMMAKPKLLMLDEPSLGLAPLVLKDIFSCIRDLRSDALGILLVEQNARAALSLADRAYVMESGRIVLSGTGAELLGNDSVIDAYLGRREAA